MTLAVPKELKKNMEIFPEMNWSEVARQAFKRKLHDLELLKNFTSESNITDEDALKWGREVSKKVSQRLRKKTK